VLVGAFSTSTEITRQSSLYLARRSIVGRFVSCFCTTVEKAPTIVQKHEIDIR